MYVGIDISKDSFFAASLAPGTNRPEAKKHPYKTQGDIEAFIASLGEGSHCVMEATGVYHKRLAYALSGAGVPVSVVNPRSIKHFAQMKGLTAKTDAEDAKAIRLYAEEQKPAPYEKPCEKKDALDQRRTVLSALEKQLQMLKNLKESLDHQPFMDACAAGAVQGQIASLERQVKELKDKIKELAGGGFAGLYKALLTIPSVGHETAVAFIEAFNSFQGKDSRNASKAFCKYIGLVPVIHESGKSVKRAAHIGRSSCPGLRQKLYMAVFSSIYNAKADHPAKTVFNRLRQKGKAFKEALVAAMHKVARIAFAVCVNGGCFIPDFAETK